jgi:hypothetical protein
LINMARDIVSDSEFRRLERAAGGDRKKLARMLIDHLVEVGAASAQGLTRLAKRPSPRHALRRLRKQAPVADDRQKGLFDD